MLKKQSKQKIKTIYSLVEGLENSIMDGHKDDLKLLTEMRLGQLQNQGLVSQLKETQKENAQLLNILQNRCDETDLTQVNSKMDITTTCSTVSMVHLQYRYEELCANHNGLLKVLELRSSESKKYQDENAKLKEEMEHMKQKLASQEQDVEKLLHNFKKVKAKKNKKIERLHDERDTLKLVHNQLVLLLQKQCMDKDSFFNYLIRQTPDSTSALLIQEIRKNNILTYENCKQQQEIYYLRSILQGKASKSDSKIDG